MISDEHLGRFTKRLQDVNDASGLVETKAEEMSSAWNIAQ